MSTYLFSYRMPENYRPGRADAMAAWNAWFDSLGASVIDRGNPVFESSALGNCGGGTSPAVTHWSPPTTSSRRSPWPRDARL